MTDAIVTTTGGRVRGALNTDGVLAFRGIPYAAPPFGPRRLRAPERAEPWDGVREATRFGPIPPQPGTMIPGAPAWSPGDGDDILTANVWRPADGGTGLPVLVWVYGGAYTNGCANTYDPGPLVRAGLVVVTFNYRVGFEGFGHVPGAPDNRGLLDQVAALRWVRDNVAAFGGDPDNVTVAGESAGAGSVAALAVMPSAAGLFRRGIAHSVPCEYLSARAAEAIGGRIAAAAGVPATLGALAAVPPERLVEASSAVLRGFFRDPSAGRRHYLPTVFNPVVDGEVLPDTPLRAVAAGAAKDTALLLLHTLEEYRLFTVTGNARAVRTDEELARAAATFGLPDGGVDGYRALAPDAGVPDLYAMLMTDFLFAEYTTRLAEAAARAGGTAFLSRFAWRCRALGGALGACHAADVPFLFGGLNERDPFAQSLLDGPATDEDRALSGRMVRAWAGFAATGDPGWPAVTADRTPVKVWDLTDRTDTDTGGGARALWKDADFPPVAL